MYIKVKKRNHFLNLLEDKELAEAYFQGEDIGEYNNIRLNELQYNLRSSKRIYTIMSSFLPITRFFKIENLVGIASKVERKHQELEYSINALEIFESNLAYFIISESVSIEDCCIKNDLDPVYLRNLLENYKKQVAKPFIEYYYDENTDRVSEITEDGKCVVLPYIPYAVRKKIDEERKIQNKQTKLIQQSDDELLNKIDMRVKDLSSDSGDQGFVYKKRMVR